METDFLKTFTRIAELGSMAEAARDMGLTPAAVANQIKALEKDLGVTLIARSGRTVVPTAAGYRLLEKARPVLADMNGLRALVQESAMQGELRLGVINSALHTLIPEMLERYCRKYPDVHVHVHADVSPQLLHQLQEDIIDLAVCQHPAFDLPKTLGWSLLREEALIVIAHKSLQREPPLHLLKTQPFIRYDRKLAGGRRADAFLRAHHIEPKASFELDSLLAIALMVDRRLGVSLIPDFRSPLTATLDIAALPLENTGKARAFGVLWKRESPRGMLVQAMVEQAREMAVKYGEAYEYQGHQ